MTWITPKLDWNASTSMNAVDWNRIENNILELYNYLNSIQYTMPVGGNPYSLSFDGVNDYVNLASSAVLNITGDLTIEAWVYVTQTADSAIVSWNNAATTFPFHWLINYSAASGKVRLNLSGTPYDSNTVVPLNTWVHLAATISGSTATLYLNGVVDGTFTGIVARSSGNTFLTISKSDAQWFKGNMDDVRIWNVARTQAQIQANMNNYLLGDETGLVGYWKLNEGAGLLAADATANKNNGSLVGGVSWVTSAPNKNNQDTVKNRDVKSIDYLSSINRIENNLDAIRLAFINPVGYLGKKTWTVGKTFDFNDANRLETNVKQLYDLGFTTFQNYRYCGTQTCGEWGLIY
ncbi:LamG domain-containing protein [Paenibacillus frigoriresistens]|uniref:LamG domain-containing protein n=1 Tax=Paenibacillus alginolyticus TaxID=59839 RepID=UPI001567AB9C|nr:LamG domain-containing protein [Paenibacillus frigoriresistens]NRF91523.1 LamG domain-containing protein [Paenibacillus frigoriresistens]